MSLSFKQRAQRRLQAYRADGAHYEPRSTASTSGAFRDSPVIYYQVFDEHLAQVRKGVTYAHTLEELHYMAIDNADRLGTFDELFSIHPSFSSRNMTLRDLILTAFVGTSDGNLTSMLVCPYQGDTPYDLDTALYAVVASDLVPNTRDTPLRIALNAPLTMTRWSHMTRITLWKITKGDSQLLNLNRKINLGQAIDLRNDPSGATHYSKKALEAMKPKPKATAEPEIAQTPEDHTGNLRVAPDNVEPLSDGAQAGTATQTLEEKGDNGVVEDGHHDHPEPSLSDSNSSVQVGNSANAGEESYHHTGPSPSDPIAILHARNSAAKAIEEPEKPDEADYKLVAPIDSTVQDTRAPIALATEELEPSAKTDATPALDVSSITGPLKAAKNEDETIVVSDRMAVEAAESNPVFSALEADQETS